MAVMWRLLGATSASTRHASTRLFFLHVLLPSLLDDACCTPEVERQLTVTAYTLSCDGWSRPAARPDQPLQLLAASGVVCLDACLADRVQRAFAPQELDGAARHGTAMAPEPSSTSCEEVAETSPAASVESALASSPSRRPVAAATLATATEVAQSPLSTSTVSTSYTLPKTKPAPPPKRTYGKKRDLSATLEDDQGPTAPLVAAPAIAAAPLPRLPLKETTSIVIPETDPTADLTSEPALLRSPEDRVKVLTAAGSSSSQAPASQHTTDPTSEEEVGSKSKRPARTFSLGLEDSDDDGSSGEEDAGDTDGIKAFLANRITLQDLDAAVDRLPPVASTSAGKGDELAKSSSLPPLTPSTEEASQAAHISSEATPVRTSHDENRSQGQPRAIIVDSSGSQAAPSRVPRRRHRIVDSDESEDEDGRHTDENQKVAAAIVAGEGVQDQLLTPAATAALGEGRKERLKLLAEKRRNKEQLETARGKPGKATSMTKDTITEHEEEQPATAQDEELVDEVDAIMNEASTEKKGRNGLISRKRKSKVRARQLWVPSYADTSADDVS